MTIDINIVKGAILTAKSKGKHNTKVKISQYEIFKDSRPKVYCQCLNLPHILTELSNYTVKQETTRKQITTGYKLTGELAKLKVRQLVTTNLVISW